MREIAQNCICNAERSLAAGAAPDTVRGGYNAPPNPLVGWGGGKPPAQISPPPMPSASRFVVFGDSSPKCPSQNNFLDLPLVGNI